MRSRVVEVEGVGGARPSPLSERARLPLSRPCGEGEDEWQRGARLAGRAAYTAAMDSSTRDALPLLETKFYAPRWRAGQVERVRLVERLKRGVKSKLTLLSAPPGFGKTTLLAEWLAATPADAQRVAWVSLDERDNRPATFWTYLFNAVEGVVPGAAKSAISLFQSAQPPAVETVLPMVLNELATVSQQVVLVLDDYHVIESPLIHDGIGFLLDHMPENVHLVISSRSDPMLPLARLRARAELTEIRASDLRFSPPEAATFLNEAMALNLSADNVAALESRTEGWIAALQLAALSMQGQDDVSGFITAFAGDNRYIVDYLVEEVLQRQPVVVRDFLLRTSILGRLCGRLCDAVTEQTGGRATLETLERSNLFVVPLDDKREWYRYHHLFADVLRSHLVQERPEEVPLLHGRASTWYAAAGQAEQAILHAVAAHDLQRAAGLVELEAEGAMRSHQPVRLIEWIKPLPRRTRSPDARPEHLLRHGPPGYGPSGGVLRPVRRCRTLAGWWCRIGRDGRGRCRRLRIAGIEGCTCPGLPHHGGGRCGVDPEPRGPRAESPARGRAALARHGSVSPWYRALGGWRP